MNRATAALIAAVAAAAALTLAVATTLASGRNTPAMQPPHYGALHRSEIGAAAAGEPTCVRGAGGAATAVGGELFSGGRLEVARLDEISGRAYALEREAERRGAGPAWPQRMGLDDAGEPVAPPPTCVALP